MDLQQIENELAAIKERNKRVEADKAWERSGFRIAVICAITYVTASLVLFMIGVEEFYLGALIPTVGFFLSTLSLPMVKQWWIRNMLNSSNTKKVNADIIFIGIIIIELLVTVFAYFIPFCRGGCGLPSILNPFGLSSKGAVCTLQLDCLSQGGSPTFYLSLDFLILTVFGYLLYRILIFTKNK